MPIAKNPGNIKTGPGKSAPLSTDNLALTGAGMVGVPPNVGQHGYFPPDSLTVRLGSPAPSDDGGLISHTSDPVSAHSASAIELVPESKFLFSSNVQGAVDNFTSGVAVRPPMVGQSFKHMSFSGIPDWGSLKLHDTDLRPQAEYPYYHEYPSPTSDWTPTLADYGNDPHVDTVWNGGSTTGINGLPGTGSGLAKAGGFTNAGLDVNRSRALAVQISGVSRNVPVVVSGSVFPADRGVLAVIHWPHGDTVVDFLAQSSLNRVVAAVVLGSGASNGGGGCITKDSVPPVTCDGSPGAGKTSADTGSIFSVGVDHGGNYDSFAYPGLAGGQYDLHEINTGVSDATGESLPGWWGAGWVRTLGDITTGAGQVRWGTDPTADPDPAVVTDYGIPVLGAGPDAYGAATGGPVTVVDPFGGVIAYPDTIGSTIVTSSNFLRYRLPYLKDYSRETGLKYTPRGLDAYTTRETKRYFDIEPLYVSDPARMTTEGTEHLNQAGNYDDFAEDHWSWQVARYRHSFYIPNSNVPGPGNELGTYWLIHFKSESNFESFVRDGKMPWDPSPDGYEVYGVTPVDTLAVTSDNNLVNSATDLTGDPGTGPATGSYGYGSKSYHVLRSSIITANSTTLPVATSDEFSWTLNQPAATPASSTVVFVSGVAYFVPVNADGNWAFDLHGINLSITNPWVDFYRVDDNALTGDNPQVAPARLSSPCPMFMSVAPFAYETVLTAGTDVQDSVFGHISPLYHRLESPFQFLGLNGGGVFSDTNGPLNVDTIGVTSLGRGIRFPGDENYPSFSVDAVPRVFVRRPLARIPIQPADAVQGNGVSLNPTGAVAASMILFHSTKWNATTPIAGHYGNFITGVAPSPVYSRLALATKDVQERFLDETYRYFTSMGGDLATDSLVGPGMGGWTFGPIPAPVQIGRTTTTFTDPFAAVTVWNSKSFAQNEEYLNALAAEELQVSGLPTRNPSFPSGATVPFPSSGVLLHPQKNYSVGYVPDNTLAGGGLAVPQVDYSAATGVKSFVRCFDASFVRSATRDPSVSGQPFVVFRIDGITLSDFVYTAPGYGCLGDGLDGTKYTGIAIMVKVPGLTTWMDLGRVDGDGPSKHDPALDGAGCKIVGPNTFNSVDPVTGMVYCQVRVNVGPAVNLAIGQESAPASGLYEVPVMVKVIMNDLAKDYNLEEVYTGSPGQFGGVVTPGAAPDDVRGLCGIQVVHPLSVETAP